MKKDAAEYVTKCLTCQKAKAEHQRPLGELKPLEIPEWKWESISMDFVSSLPKTSRGHDAVDSRFTSRFWTSLHEALGTKLKLSLAYHPQTDGQTERTIQTLEDLLRACIIEQQGSWMECLPLIEFTYNNSYQASIGMAPFEALYGRKCKTPLCWYDDGEAVLLGPEMLQQITEQVKLIREKIKASQDRQKSYYDRRRKPLDFQEGEHVFLKVSPVTGVGRALKSRKLTPKYIGKEIELVKVQWGPDEGDSIWELEDRLQNSFSFLLQIARSHFRSREAHLYVVGLRISEMMGRVNLGLNVRMVVLVVPGDMSRGSRDLGDVRRAPGSQPIKEQSPRSKEACVAAGQLCILGGIWKLAFVHPEEPARTLQQPVEWILPTPTPYRLVEPVQVIEVSSSKEDIEEDLEELPPEPTVDALDFPKDDEDPLSDVDSPEDVMSASEADSTEESGPGGTANNDDSSS
ncbi:Transposon Tf2-9 polyprotein [Glycine soja]|uniref:Transposon Tf2-9 polyprotein n=1 Tax=Glycine soja TaxID=3848 RepID=A0A445GHA3_GLYSO|nr:Transposon Tf2-9 polyprotein [Glycine soja]